MRNILLISAMLVFGGCATWSTSDVTDNKNTKVYTTVMEAQKMPRNIVVTEADITDHKYKVLGDIEVTVNKTTIFNEDPTREQVNEKLKEEAAKLGADAVILVRYGTVGISLLSWGSLNGKGRAIVFVD